MRKLVLIPLQKLKWEPSFIWFYRVSSLSYTGLSPSQHFILLPNAKAILFYVNFPSIQTFSQNIILLAIYNFCSPHFTSAFPVALQNGRDDRFLWSNWFRGESPLCLLLSVWKKTQQANKQWNGQCAHCPKPSHLWYTARTMLPTPPGATRQDHLCLEKTSQIVKSKLCNMV